MVKLRLPWWSSGKECLPMQGTQVRALGQEESTRDSVHVPAITGELEPGAHLYNKKSHCRGRSAHRRGRAAPVRSD